jgi:ubiquinone/menaquinone biosynthesis C-methylase UbiE
VYDRIHFSMISLVHDKLYRLLVDSFELLLAAGIRSGQRVLEVGCGPGSFTIPAAKMVGSAGSVCALDINPVAVQTVQRRVERSGLTNVEVVLADAVKSGLPGASFDLAFLFGVIHDFPDARGVIQEMHRVLKVKGSQLLMNVYSLRDTEGQDRRVGTRPFHFSRKVGHLQKAPDPVMVWSPRVARRL